MWISLEFLIQRLYSLHNGERVLAKVTQDMFATHNYRHANSGNELAKQADDVAKVARTASS